MGQNIQKEPTQAWVTVFAGVAINLCLGILYAWSVWGTVLTDVEKAGQPMTGLNEGWLYLTNAQALTPYSVCVIIFAILMIFGGKMQDRVGPRFSATLGGLLLATGCIIAGLMKSYTGLIVGFGVFGGIGMGIGYAAPTPAALKWFGPHRRGLIAGIVVSGYGGAALYVGPLANYLIKYFGITGSFMTMGVFFAAVVVIAGQLLKTPPADYVPPTLAGASVVATKGSTLTNWKPGEMIKTWQFYALAVMFLLTTQSGLLVIAFASKILKEAAKDSAFLTANSWILVSYGGLINAVGRVGTGFYSDKIGRLNAYCLNCGVSALCLFSLPYIMNSGSIPLLFLAVGIAYWQYGGGLSLMPSFAADFYGPKNLGVNYGLLFIGWGLGFFMARLGGTIKDLTGSLDMAFYISGTLLVAAVVLAKLTRRPMYHGETVVE